MKINITFEEETTIILSELADAEHKSVASLVQELTLEALEEREDLCLSKLAENEQQGIKIYSHDEAWK